MNRVSVWIVLAYGIFLGWLLSFPYNGPVLIAATADRGLPAAPFSLTYTAVPALFLIGFSIFTFREKYAKAIMIGCVITCLTGTLLIFFLDSSWWFPVLSVMGICSVVYIIYWSIYFTRQIPVSEKMKMMALVIITGNVCYYLFRLTLPFLSMELVLTILIGMLLLSLWSSIRMEISNPIQIHLESGPFPTRLVFVVCLFLFVIRLNGGITFHVIYPSFDEMFSQMFSYYGMLPYILTLFVFFLWGHKIPKMLPVYLGTSFLGLAYLFFGTLDETTARYFLVETLLQAGWAVLHLFLWTLFSEIASVYGRPLKICSLAFLATLSAMFFGGMLGLYIMGNTDNYYPIASGNAVLLVFICFLIVPWLNKGIEQDYISRLNRKVPEFHPGERENEIPGGISLVINLPNTGNLLTAREMEVAGLLLQGYTNIAIAQKLKISKHTVKSHTRNIYSKMSVANKKELLQLACTNAPDPRC